MDGKIGLEEHFAIAETLHDSKGFLGDAVWPELESRLLDIQEKRLRLMDAHGMELMLLSLNAPAVQAIPDPARAAEMARRANDFLAREVAKRPQRFQGLAALAMQDPDEATRELRRCVRELGFRGALVNGFSQVRDPNSMVYLDDARHRGFWAELEKLDVPFYLHPRNPLPSAAQIYEGHPWLLGPTWAFGQETAVHALRLMASGLFDAHPRLKIILGHLGESLPFSAWRINMALSRGADKPSNFRDTFCEHFWITTSGNFSTPALMCCIMEMGVDRILFSVDYPFVPNPPGTKWMADLPLSLEDRVKILSGNVKRLLRM